MSERQRITYVFRRPKFPVICSIEGEIAAIASLRAFEGWLARFNLDQYREIDVIAANGDNWVLLPEQMALAPDFLGKRWRKVDIIRLFNESLYAKERGLQYPESVIPNRRVDAIVKDLVMLLSKSRYRRG